MPARDFMTSHWAHLPRELLGRVSNRIIKEVRGIYQVVYDISGKPPATIEWERRGRPRLARPLTFHEPGSEISGVRKVHEPAAAWT